ncbi:MAG TPA: glycosyltransferase family 39 protein, partial [Solirubrobacteraceae bacterium]
RSMLKSWHNFFFVSFDPGGLVSVDKPPLALWLQAVSAKVFGFSSFSILLPEALAGVGAVWLLYLLVARYFGRVAGLAAALALAVSPVSVSVNRDNNPDALLALLLVASVYFAARAAESGRLRWLIGSAVLVGLAFNTKMLAAMVVVPGIALASVLVAPRGRLRAVRQLLAGGTAMLLVGGAWPALMALTPAADRPWISGTSDNSIVSLIFEYNGLGRVDGQAGGPAGLGGGGGAMFGGSTGPLRLLNSALGGQAGWLLGFALVSAVGLLVLTRLRRADARSGWLVAVGGAFLTTAVLFSFASGIFHPYYVSLLAPFAAALVGAGAAQMLGGGRAARVLAPLALAGGMVTELAVLHDYPGQLSWLPPLLIAACALAALALALTRSKRARLVAAGVGIGALLLAPSVWALDTLGHATSGTFPEGGPANVQRAGGGAFGGPGGRGGFGGFGAGAGAGSGAASPVPVAPGVGTASAGPLFGPGGGEAGSAQAAGPPQGAPPGVRGFGRASGGPAGFGAGFGGGSPIGNDRTITQALAYVEQHGGGTIAVSSQSSAASAIIASGAKVAGIGGFSGRESDVSASWLAQRVRSGAIRWVLVEGTGAQRSGPGLPGDTRPGSKAAMTAVAKACSRVALTMSAGSASGAASSPVSARSGGMSGGGEAALYDCRGDAAALANA